ncbi:nuclear transport factor 2 [Callorhinchus milii]|uniref:Nuclear transport factor 2 n=1 Tax=Callorhinchus milii TaxID=7868 RepID=V9LH95_CALMI|nr:nuclear transport factor 2 [Callorhinchus milii]XP_042188413.1 nuclear transport factor 2 [Callorhinchus milii]|eukprot:gi/632968870/ref/XP_007900774.1/ PREDICTED: nuclear transport factor 2-like [Callorhinchus milii]
MGESPIWEQVGAGFVQVYYQQFDTNRSELGSLYGESSCLTWEGQQFQGKTAIMEKINSLPFQKIQHSVTTHDHQPTVDGSVLTMVVGQLQVDDDPVMGFQQLFVLKNMDKRWICMNDMFRLALHNFA